VGAGGGPAPAAETSGVQANQPVFLKQFVDPYGFSCTALNNPYTGQHTYTGRHAPPADHDPGRQQRPGLR
jgi:hypothetical protein